jgi:hypothetical protein
MAHTRCISSAMPSNHRVRSRWGPPSEVQHFVRSESGEHLVRGVIETRAVRRRESAHRYRDLDLSLSLTASMIFFVSLRLGSFGSFRSRRQVAFRTSQS